MRFSDYITLGLKNTWRRKSRSFLTIFAVVIGAISIIIMLSLVFGAQKVATKQLESIDGLTLISVSASPEVQQGGSLLNPNQNFDETSKQLNDSTISLLKQIPNVVDAIPLVSVWVKTIKLEGQDKKFYANVIAYPIDNKVLHISVSAGRALQEGDMDKIVIGSGILDDYGYSSHPQDIIGKNLTLYFPQSVNWGPEPPMPPQNADKDYWDNISKQMPGVNAEIIGVANGPDQGQSYITLDWGKRLMTSRQWGWDDAGRKAYDEMKKQIIQQLQQQLGKNGKDFNLDAMANNQMAAQGYNDSNFQTLLLDDNLQRNGYSSILVRVDNTNNIEQVGKDIQKLGLGVQTAKQMLDDIKRIFTLIGLIVGAIGGIVLFVAALGIINNMIMATYERTREIGILRSCGATRANIRNMFIFEASSLGFLGGVIGLILSFGLAKILNLIGNQIAISQNLPINNLLSFPLWLIIGVIALTTFIGAFAGLLPAIRASHLDPVEALRYE